MFTRRHFYFSLKSLTLSVKNAQLSILNKTLEDWNWKCLPATVSFRLEICLPQSQKWKREVFASCPFLTFFLRVNFLFLFPSLSTFHELLLPFYRFLPWPFHWCSSFFLPVLFTILLDLHFPFSSLPFSSLHFLFPVLFPLPATFLLLSVACFPHVSSRPCIATSFPRTWINFLLASLCVIGIRAEWREVLFPQMSPTLIPPCSQPDGSDNEKPCSEIKSASLVLQDGATVLYLLRHGPFYLALNFFYLNIA